MYVFAWRIEFLHISPYFRLVLTLRLHAQLRVGSFPEALVTKVFFPLRTTSLALLPHPSISRCCGEVSHNDWATQVINCVFISGWCAGKMANTTCISNSQKSSINSLKIF